MNNITIRQSLISYTAIALCCMGHCLADMSATCENDPLKQLRQLANADPVKDFEADKLKKDIHFVGVLGITIIVPGVDKKSEYYKRVETRIVEGTSDVMPTEEQRALTKKVLVYAESYNKCVLKYLSDEELNRRGK